MNAEDAIIAKKRKRFERVEVNPNRHSEQGSRPKKGRTKEKKDQDNKKLRSSGRSQQYTPLNMPLEQVLMQIKDDPSLKWPEKIKGDPNKRNRNNYCRFHRDHGYDTDKCFDLKQHIENLIRQGKLRTTVQRNKSHHRGKFDRPVVQVQESILEGGVERLNFWMITKGKVHGRTSNHFHE